MATGFAMLCAILSWRCWCGLDGSMLSESQPPSAPKLQLKSGHQVSEMSSLNDLEFAFAPVRDTVRDLREYL
jgi:hypothetical protein